MNPLGNLRSHPLIATRTDLARSDDEDTQRESNQKQLAWQRAMEQAGMKTWFEPSRASAFRGETNADHAAGTASPFSNADKPAATAWRDRGTSAPLQFADEMSRDGTPGLADAEGTGELYGRLLSSPGEANALIATTYNTDPSAVFQQDSPVEESVVWTATPMATLRQFHSTDTATNHTQPDPAERLGETRHTAADLGDGHTQTTPSGIRLYSEWSGDNVRIWLGADRAEAPAVVPLVGRLRRWLAGHGVRLLGVVCNGRTVQESNDASLHEPRLVNTNDF